MTSYLFTKEIWLWKLLTKPVVMTLFTNRFSLPQSPKPPVALNPLIKRNSFSPSTIQFSNSSNGFSAMTAMMSVWNPQVNIGFLSLIFWQINQCCLCQSQVGKRCERQQRWYKDPKWIENHSVSDLPKTVIFLARKSVFSGNTLAIVSSWVPAVQVKWIDIRMHLLFVSFH